MTYELDLIKCIYTYDKVNIYLLYIQLIYNFLYLFKWALAVHV